MADFPDELRKEWNAQSAAHAARLEQMGLPALSMYFDRQGKAIGFGDWAALRHREHEGDFSYKFVALDKINGVRVSTVWVGLDMGLMGRPLIFETMVFDDDADMAPFEDFTRRYATEEEAHAGHELAVAKLRSMLDSADLR